jgi:hypothetical protein
LQISEQMARQVHLQMLSPDIQAGFSTGQPSS